MKLLAFDPGQTTGYCVFEDARFVEGGTVEDDLAIDKLLSRIAPDLVIYETFRLFPNKAKALIGSEFVPVQIIGTLLYLCKVRGIKVLGQAPMVKKFFMPVARLKCYAVKLTSEHARDAARHILYWLVFKQKLLPLPKEDCVTETSVGKNARHTKKGRGHSRRARSSQLLRKARRKKRPAVRRPRSRAVLAET